MAGAARYDLFERAGKAMPDTFGAVADAMKAVHMKDGIPAFLPENYYGWSFIPCDASKPAGAPRKLLDVSKLTALGWRPRIDLELGIRQTYDWYRASLEMQTA